jgi:hypothetical protein
MYTKGDSLRPSVSGQTGLYTLAKATVACARLSVVYPVHPRREACVLFHGLGPFNKQAGGEDAKKALNDAWAGVGSRLKVVPEPQVVRKTLVGLLVIARDGPNHLKLVLHGLYQVLG